jgi:hypothetical protein
LATLAKRFFGHWRAATKYGVQSGWFSWAIAVATVLIAYWQSRQLAPPPVNTVAPVLTQTSWIAPLLNIAWVPPLLSICGALVIVVLFNALFLAPGRAWRMLHPFRVRLVVNTGDDVYPKGQFEAQRAAVSITNRSYCTWGRCVLHVISVDGLENKNHAFPRFIEEFSLEADQTKEIAFLFWTAREPPNSNDPILTFGGPISPAYGSNRLTLPIGPAYAIGLRIGAPGSNPICVRCRVWTASGSLCSTLE